jgi:hypothetical protein
VRCVTDALNTVQSVAARFGAGDATTREMWSALHANLHELSADGSLQGDYLNLFNALEQWETAVGDDRAAAEAEARAVAARLGDRS